MIQDDVQLFKALRRREELDPTGYSQQGGLKTMLEFFKSQCNLLIQGMSRHGLSSANLCLPNSEHNRASHFESRRLITNH